VLLILLLLLVFLLLLLLTVRKMKERGLVRETSVVVDTEASIVKTTTTMTRQPSTLQE
jgi:hypothetical protein